MVSDGKNFKNETKHLKKRTDEKMTETKRK